MTQEKSSFPQNLILFGTSGTGKTYQSINYAVAIIEEKSIQEIQKKNREEVQKRFQYYQEKGQVAWVTFHPSFSYEDFVQGLKPNTQANTLLFERHDGILKKIADRARKNYDLSHQVKPQIPFEELLDLLLSRNINVETEEIEFPLLEEHRIYQSIIIFEVNEEGLIYKRRSKRNIIHPEERRELSIKKLQALYQGKEIKEAINLKYYQIIVNAVQEFEQTLETGQQVQKQNYVLLIDEVNRGNLPHILGELIPLLEADKRYQAPHEMSIQLPSGEEFSLPSNLYLIGTMNTSDKSIAPIDKALRRRFHFEAFYPKPELVADKTIQKLMIDLNKTLWEEQKDEALLLGHAYFMDKTDQELPQLINQVLIPLLMDFFHQQQQQVERVLNNVSVKTKVENYQLIFESYGN